MNIAVAGGKGGTGKTTVAVNLAALMAQSGQEPLLIDCDVEEPNAHVFLPIEWNRQTTEYITVPDVNTEKCLGESCKKCIELCRFKALIWMVDSVMVFPELCHACGLCFEACPADAIIDSKREIGDCRRGTAHYKDKAIPILDGVMRVGEAMSPPLIKRVKAEAGNEPLQIWDCPPGTSCPVIASFSGADYVLLVAEPTAFGLHDLDLVVQTVRILGLPFGICINRHGMGDDRVERYMAENNIPHLGNIPHTLEAAQAYSRGELLIDADSDLQEAFRMLAENLSTQTTDPAKEAV